MRAAQDSAKEAGEVSRVTVESYTASRARRDAITEETYSSSALLRSLSFSTSLHPTSFFGSLSSLIRLSGRLALREGPEPELLLAVFVIGVRKSPKAELLVSWVADCAVILSWCL